MRWKRNRSGAPIAVAAAAVTAAVTAALVAGCSGGPAAGPGHTPDPARTPAGFGWFRAAAAPAGWQQARLPDGGAVLSFPASLRPMPGDAGTVTRGLARAGAVLVYLNATPRQGDERLRGWATFRLDHLRNDDARSATADHAATGLAFHGGTGSCVIDDYVTRVRAHHYREIACYVQGTHAASVLIAAAPAAAWARYAGLLERAVDSYAVS
jgi:hypothetical protein